MIAALQASEEEKRLKELEALGLMDSPEETAFTNIVELASLICEAPICLITLIDSKRQWFKARTGLAFSETDRSLSFCVHAIQQNSLFVVRDALNDDRFKTNPLVIGSPGIRFYAGEPITSPNGYKLGTLCVIDSRPRELSWQQANSLKILANQVNKLVELTHQRKKVNELARLLAEKQSIIEGLQRKNQRQTDLTTQQMQERKKFLQSQSEILRKGKFTKKDITELAEKADYHVGNIDHFCTNTYLLSGRDFNDQAESITSFDLSTFTKEIIESQQTLIQRNRNKVLTYVPENLKIRHNPLILDHIFKTILEFLLHRLSKADIHFVVEEQHHTLHFHISFLKELESLNLTTATKESSKSSSEAIEYDLAFIYELIESLQGAMLVKPLGNQGTTISIELRYLS